MMGRVEVLSPGLQSSIQDKGRYGYRSYGVPISGVMDQLSSELGNALLGNDANDSVLEITMIGPKLLFHNQTMIAITGANISPMVNGKVAKTNTVISIKEGNTLSFGKLQYGCRSYLCIKGGFEVSKDIGSKSTYEPAKLGFPILKKGMSISFHEQNSSLTPSNSRIKANLSIFNESIIDVVPGPEFDLMDNGIIDQTFEIGLDSNRMGYRLLGTKTLPHNHSILTSSVMPGTIQLPPSGNPVVLMRDCQTTGGYPRILQVTDFGMNVLAQKKPGDKIKFKLPA